MKEFRFIAVVLILVGSGVATYLKQSKFKEASFHGTYIAYEERTSVGRRSRGTVIEMLIEADDGTQVKWVTEESKANYYQIGDYLVKPPGKKYPAVFRKGKQLRNTGVPYYLDEEIDLAQYRGTSALRTADSSEDKEPPTAAELPPTTSEKPFGLALEPASAPVAAQPATAQPAAQPAAAPAAAAPASPWKSSAAPGAGTEADAQRLLTEAAGLWEKKDYNGSIAKSEEALKIRIALYGENHYLVVDIRRRITLAQQKMAAQ